MSFNTPPNQKKIIGFGMILSVPKEILLQKWVNNKNLCDKPSKEQNIYVV